VQDLLKMKGLNILSSELSRSKWYLLFLEIFDFSFVTGR